MIAMNNSSQKLYTFSDEIAPYRWQFMLYPIGIYPLGYNCKQNVNDYINLLTTKKYMI